MHKRNKGEKLHGHWKVFIFWHAKNNNSVFKISIVSSSWQLMLFVKVNITRSESVFTAYYVDKTANILLSKCTHLFSGM